MSNGRMTLMTAALLLAVAANGAMPPTEPDAGAVLRARTLATLDGDATSLEAFAGEILVVNFWASWCAPCREELPLMDSWDTAWRDRGARVVAVSIDQERDNARQLVEQLELQLTALYDGPRGLAVQLDLAAVPSSYLLDRAGRVVMVVHGSGSADLERLHREVEALLSGERSRS